VIIEAAKIKRQMSISEIIHSLIRRWIVLVILLCVTVYFVDRTTSRQSQYVSEVNFLFEPQSTQVVGKKVRFRNRWVTLTEKNRNRITRFIRAREADKFRNIIGGSTFRSKILLDTVTYRDVEDLLVNHMISEVKERRKRNGGNRRQMKLTPISTTEYSDLSHQERTQLGMIGMMLFQTEEIGKKQSNSDVITLTVKSGQYDLTQAIVEVVIRKLPEMVRVSSPAHLAHDVRKTILELNKEDDDINEQLARTIDRNQAVTAYVSTTNVSSIVRKRRVIRREIAMYENILGNMSAVNLYTTDTLTPLSDIASVHQEDPPYIRNVIMAIIGSIITYMFVIVGFVYLKNIINDSNE